MIVYRRPGNGLPLIGPPRLASWDRAGHPSQVQLAQFLAEVDGFMARLALGDRGALALELVVGTPSAAALDCGGRDLDNYLFPVVQHLGATRFVAVFGRKVHGQSTIAIGPAEPVQATVPARFSTRLTGSYSEQPWKHQLRDRLLHAALVPGSAGALALDVAITTGPGRNWANLWKPLIDSLGPVLGEDPHRPFHPNDDRITALSLYHHTDPALGHDVEVALWWAPAGADAGPPSQRTDLPR